MLARVHAFAIVAIALSAFAVSSPIVAQDATEWVGQIACSKCWFEADRSQVAYGGAEDRACAKRCEAEGIPAVLAVRDATHGFFELYTLDGPAPDDGPSWTELAGSFVRVTGRSFERDGAPALRVATLERLAESPWPAPDGAATSVAMSWTDLSGYPLGLEDLRGRIAVVNFWATWCAPCVKEMPDLVKVQNKYGMLGVQVIGASADERDASGQVLDFARTKKLNFPVVLGADTSQMQSLGLGAALPATVVLDREGRVVDRFIGVFKRPDLEASIERALAGDDTHAGHDHGDHEGTAEEGDGSGKPVVVASATAGPPGKAKDEASLVPS